MLFLLAMDLPVGSQVPFETNPQLPLDPIQLAVPVEIDEAEVESFDPVARAAKLAASLPRQWCGTFEPFDGNPTVDVSLDITQLTAMGQMVDIRGTMTLGSATTPVQGNLHAKSDQLDLIPLGRSSDCRSRARWCFPGPANVQSHQLAGTSPRQCGQSEHRGGWTSGDDQQLPGRDPPVQPLLRDPMSGDQKQLVNSFDV